MVDLDSLNEGDLCRMRYKSQSGNYRWYEYESTAVFISHIKGNPPFSEDLAVWSLRPEAGTMSVPTNRLVSVDVIDTVASRHSRNIFRDDDRCKRPKRLKGAVSAP